MRLHRATEPLLCMALPTTLRKELKIDSIACPTDQSPPFETWLMPFVIKLHLATRGKKSQLLCCPSHKRRDKRWETSFSVSIPRDWRSEIVMMITVAFTNGLKDQDLVKSLYLNPPDDFNNIIESAKKHVIVDATL